MVRSVNPHKKPANYINYQNINPCLIFDQVMEAGIGNPSPLLYNEKIWFLDENGVTRVFKAGREFELLPENKIEGKFWSSAAIAGDAYIFRGVEKLYCLKE